MAKMSGDRGNGRKVMMDLDEELDRIISENKELLEKLAD